MSFYNFGNLGGLVRVVPENSANSVGVTENMIVLIVDRSGSMGEYFNKLISRIIPDALHDIGYPDTKQVVLITFNGDVERIDTTVGGLRSITTKAGGGTSMRNVFPELEHVLNTTLPSVSVDIIAISDGEIYDQKESVAAAQKASTGVAPRSAPVSVNLYRLMTSAHASPDTRALTCVAIFNTGGKVDLKDISWGAPEIADKQMSEHLRADLVLKKYVCLQSPTSSLRLLPGDSPTSTLAIRCGVPTYVMVALGCAPESLTCGGKAVDFSCAVADEDNIREFIEEAYSRLCYWKVMGAREPQIAENVAWFERVADVLASSVPATATANVRERARGLIAAIKARSRGSINKILELNNLGRLEKLNSAQAAAFLRGDIASVGTAKRTAKMLGDTDFDGICRAGVLALATNSLGVAACVEANEESSYCSLCTWSDVLSAGAELGAVAGDLGAAEILTVVGGIGVSFRINKGDYPDPWSAHVAAVYPDTLYLGQSDLHLSGSELTHPGSGGGLVNGVVPLRFLNAKAFDLYEAACGGIADLQASVMLRGAVAKVPYDRLALVSAVYWRLACQVGPGAGTEPEQAILADLLGQIRRALSTYARASFAELADNLGRADPRAWLTGDLGVSGILKPLIVIVASPDFVGSDTARALRAVYALAAYKGARHAFRDGGREEALHALLGIDLAESRRRSDVGAPFEPDGVDAGNLPVDMAGALQRAKALKWMPSLDTIAGGVRADGVRADGDVYQADSDLLRLGAAAEALHFADEASRIDKSARVALGPEPGDADAIFTFLYSISSKIYAADYAARIGAKRAKEHELRTTRTVEALTACASHAEFLKILCVEAYNRDAPVVAPLMANLVNPDLVAPLRTEKLWTLILGRDRAGGEVWASGNIYRGDYSPFATIFADHDPSGDLWEQLRSVKEEYGVHRYREARLNRQGHGNAKPSYWAFGFKSIGEYQAAVTPAQYADYVAEHTTCCGFARH